MECSRNLPQEKQGEGAEKAKIKANFLVLFMFFPNFRACLKSDQVSRIKILRTSTLAECLGVGWERPSPSDETFQ